MNGFAQKIVDRAQRAADALPVKLRASLLVRAFGLWKVPLLAWVRPVVEELSLERCVVRIPLTRRTKNHLGSLYFGAYAIGADIAGALIATEVMRVRRRWVAPVFKDMQADFLARAEADVLFACDDGAAIAAAVDRALDTGERVNLPVRVVATCPAKLGERSVARFALTLSLKSRR